MTRPVVGLLMASLLCLLSARSIHALEPAEGVQLHGFMTQSYVLTSANNFFGESQENGSFDFRELGLNGSWRALSNVQFSAQVLSRRAGESDDGDLRLDYGFLDYSFFSDANNLWGLRLGRTMNPLGLYNDTRDVAFIRPSILLPQSIYFDRVRNIALSSDSIHLYGERRTNIGDFFFQLVGGFPRVDDPAVERAIFSGDVPGELESRPSLIGRIIYEINGGLFRFALSGAQVNADYDSAPASDPLRDGSWRFEPLIFSAQYNAEKWSLTSEYALRNIRYSDFGPFFSDLDFTGESYYLQATYRFHPNWEGLLRYDVFFADRNDRSGKAFERITGRAAHTRFAKDLTVGLRWDVTPSFTLRAEYHHINGTGWITVDDNPSVSDLEQRWNMFLLLGSYRF
jgi:hypothetical protein